MFGGPGGNLQPATYVKIDELAPGSVGHNVVAKVVGSELIVDRPRFNGETRIAEVKLADETGCVLMRARGEQIEKLPVGAVIVLRNAGISMFKGHMRVVVNKWGKVSPHPDSVKSTPPPPASVNTDNDKSQVEYELVQVGEEGDEEGSNRE